MDDDKINSVLQDLYRLAYPMAPHGVHTQIFHDAIEVIACLRKERDDYKVSSDSLFNQVMIKIPQITDPQDKFMVEKEVKYLLSKDWNVSDVIFYISSMNEVDPELDEDIAIQRMNQIRSKYQSDKNEL